MKWLGVIGLFAALPASAQLIGSCHGTFYLGDIRVVFTTLSTERMSVDELCGFREPERDVIHRVVFDREKKPVFGYDMRISRKPGTRELSVTVTRPSSGTKLASFPNLPPPMTISDGDRVDVPILHNPDTDARILDSYAISLPGTVVTTMPKVGGFPRELPNSARIVLERPHLVSEVSDVGENPDFGVSGPVVWVYGRWLGRFLFSARPRPGYRRQAVAEGPVIRFTEGVEQYTMKLKANAVAEPGTWSLWVRREPDFKPPAGPWTDQELRTGMLAIGAER